MMICIHVAQGSLPLSLKTPGVEASSVVRGVTDRYRQDHFNQHVQIGSNPPRLCGPGCAAQEVGQPRSVRTGPGMQTTFDHIPPSWRSTLTTDLFVCLFLCVYRLPPPTLPPPPLLHLSLLPSSTLGPDGDGEGILTFAGKSSVSSQWQR